LCDHVAILDHGRLVLAGSVDDITRSNRERDLGLSRPLLDAELQRLLAIPGVRSIERTSVPAGNLNHDARSAEYLAKLDLSAEGIDQDAVIAALLKAILDMGITPRKLTEGRSLESQFLKVTGAPPAPGSD
jgi:ABC-type uncharacterized transport system ATPase subunit